MNGYAYLNEYLEITHVVVFEERSISKYIMLRTLLICLIFALCLKVKYIYIAVLCRTDR